MSVAEGVPLDRPPPARKLPGMRERLLALTILPMTNASPGAFGAFWRSQEGIRRELVEQSGAWAE
jgi:hypothetical protein